MAVANKPEDDAALQRKLWLAIARRLVQSACSSDGEDTAVGSLPGSLPAAPCLMSTVMPQAARAAAQGPDLAPPCSCCPSGCGASCRGACRGSLKSTWLLLHGAEGGLAQWSSSHRDQGAPGTVQVSGISQVNDLLRDAGGLVKIEDLLPLFPDFVTIDAFREAIHESLEQYSAHIDQLKQEMSDATRIADALRLNGCVVSWVGLE